MLSIIRKDVEQEEYFENHSAERKRPVKAFGGLRKKPPRESSQTCVTGISKGVREIRAN